VKNLQHDPLDHVAALIGWIILITADAWWVGAFMLALY
jgi:hypothetical protein